jgi:hypothetical protein
LAVLVAKQIEGDKMNLSVTKLISNAENLDESDVTTLHKENIEKNTVRIASKY